jgi:hypothetical protein
VSPELLLSSLSVVIAFGALVVNFALSHRASVRARKPVLVFVFGDEHDRTEWVLRNVGNGPALNVLVAVRSQGEWFNPVRVPPLAKDASFRLTWVMPYDQVGLGASYGDFEGRRYTATLGDEVARAYDGDRLPEWNDAEIVRYWDISAAIATASSWGARRSDFTA